MFDEGNHRTAQCRWTGWETLHYSVMGVLFVAYELSEGGTNVDQDVE